MKNYPRAALKKLVHRYNIIGILDLMKKGPLHDDGWFRSVREAKSVDASGKPMIWINYPTIDFLKNRINKNMAVFEFGAGASTLWWSERVGEVLSCEHDEQWFLNVKENLPDNVQIWHVNLGEHDEYPKKVTEIGRLFNIIVIDGRQRNACAKYAIKALKEDGVIIWDNTNMPEYNEGINFLFENGFKKIEFSGMPPGNNAKTETSIFYRQNNCLGI